MLDLEKAQFFVYENQFIGFVIVKKFFDTVDFMLSAFQGQRGSLSEFQNFSISLSSHLKQNFFDFENTKI